MSLKRLAIALGISAGLLGSSSVVAMQDATPDASPIGGSGLPAGCTVIADGLINPRYVAVGDDRTIYVSEAGTGGDELVQPPVDPLATPVDGEDSPPPGNRGTSGQVTMISPDGTQSVLAIGLPSYANGFEVIGPAGITVSGGQILLAVGGAGPAAAFTEALPNENSVVSIDPASGDLTLMSDVGANEPLNNPDGLNIDTNLYGIAVDNDGTIYVNDAGGNTTYRVTAGGGDPEVVAVHEGLPLPEGMNPPPGGNPGRGGANELDPVPTDVMLTLGDADVLVGLLSGGPFPPGAAKVLNVANDGTTTDVATGSTMVVGLTAAPDEHVYASQLSTNFLAEVPEAGNVVRLLENGSQEVVLEGLILPNGITFDEEGNLLVVVNSVSLGEPNGQVLRCEGISDVADSSPGSIAVALHDAALRAS